MKIYRTLDTAKFIRFPTITIGTFDGVHIGHQRVINYLNEQAKKMNGESVVITFEPHPKTVIMPENHNVKLIQTNEEKYQKLQKYGVQNLVIIEFTHELSQLSAEEFLQNILIEQLNAKQIVIGYDHRFGHNREGNIDFLREKSKNMKFSVVEIPATTIDEITISSTKIRNALQKGDIQTANNFLGEYYILSGVVVKGKQLGKKIGFPTANLQINDPLKLIPMDGIYIVITKIKDTPKTGILSIGTNPTVENNSKQTIEVFLLDYDGNLYGETLELKFIHFIRPTEKFNSIEELILQMQYDEQYTQNYMELHDSKRDNNMLQFK